MPPRVTSAELHVELGSFQNQTNKKCMKFYWNSESNAAWHRFLTVFPSRCVLSNTFHTCARTHQKQTNILEGLDSLKKALSMRWNQIQRERLRAGWKLRARVSPTYDSLCNESNNWTAPLNQILYRISKLRGEGGQTKNSIYMDDQVWLPFPRLRSSFHSPTQWFCRCPRTSRLLKDE